MQRAQQLGLACSPGSPLAAWCSDLVRGAAVTATDVKVQQVCVCCCCYWDREWGGWGLVQISCRSNSDLLVFSKWVCGAEVYC